MSVVPTVLLMRYFIVKSRGAYLDSSDSLLTLRISGRPVERWSLPAKKFRVDGAVLSVLAPPGGTRDSTGS